MAASTPNRHAMLHGATGLGAFTPARSDLLRVGSRRWFLQTGLAGCAGLSAASLAAAAARASESGGAPAKSVILFWLSGGPSHVDMWDPKPDAPSNIRGPYESIETAVPGVRICEHLPLQASIADKLTFIRSVDCSASNHTPITMQAGNPLARRTDDGRDGGGFPSMGSVAARFCGPAPGSALPPFIGLADSMLADVYGAGHLGGAFEPIQGTQLAGRMAMPETLSIERLADRAALKHQIVGAQRAWERDAALGGVDRSAQLAFDLVTSAEAQQAFDLSREPDVAHEAYGRTSVGQKALLARRLVEAGCRFLVVSGAWGYFDHHGDNVPPWGGILKGLTPILPTVDRALHALVLDLEARGLLDSTLVLMMGEFGRSPAMNNDAGRDHWTNVMSMVVAGGGLRHGQVIGSTDRSGGSIATRRVGPADLAATVFRHLEIPLETHWVNPQGRPIPIVVEGGQPIGELF